MSNYDPVLVFSTAVDSAGTSNGIINSSTNNTGILIHKVVLRNTGALASVPLTVAINDDSLIGTTNLVFTLRTNSSSTFAEDEYENYRSESFDPPLPIQRGLSLDLTGTAASVQVYYTRR